ncbi:competence type IV pilus minor pilin ComGG [Streptococcus suis]|uniref:competence type IV pilus minor pilin ComGG n=1 Tax=Streptococcus suis TaxID=1307 RepID=UPI002A794DC6|nr:competence protein ComGG [Streptococcus suis]
MLLKKKVKAGILLYALLMLAVFSLLLQFYLHRQEAESRLVQVARQETTAYIMAQMVLDKVEEELQDAKKVASQTEQQEEVEAATSETANNKEEGEVQETTSTKPEPATKSVDTSSTQNVESKPIEGKGTVAFQQGQASYHVKNQQLSVLVVLRDGREYRYQFGMKSRD